MRVFAENQRFYRGNTHCHTTRSDGRLTPEEAAAVYRRMGYDFLALTDHRVLSEQPCWAGDMLMLPGLEMDFVLPGEALHLVGVGMDASFAERKEEWLRSPQSCVDVMRACGGRAILAHPHWSLNTLKTLASLQNVTAAEIYNSVSDAPWNGARADSSNVLDVAAAQGVFFNFVAADDSHFYTGEAGRGYTMVQAEELSREGILNALDAGRFYASQGPEFHQIVVENDVVTVECSPVRHVIFDSHLPWSDERCRSGDGLTQARYSRNTENGERFLRVHLIDAEGKQAWSNVIHFESDAKGASR